MEIILDVSEYQSPAQLDAILADAPDTIVAVYIKAAQDLVYRDEAIALYARICQRHSTLFGYYDYMGNHQTAEQSQFFTAAIAKAPTAALVPMLDCEGTYDLYEIGVQNFRAHLGERVIEYSSLAYQDRYASERLRWVAQYPEPFLERGSDVPASSIEQYRSQGFTAWQFTDRYLGQVDASVLLVSLDALRV